MWAHERLQGSHSPRLVSPYVPVPLEVTGVLACEPFEESALLSGVSAGLFC